MEGLQRALGNVSIVTVEAPRLRQNTPEAIALFLDEVEIYRDVLKDKQEDPDEEVVLKLRNLVDRSVLRAIAMLGLDEEKTVDDITEDDLKQYLEQKAGLQGVALVESAAVLQKIKKALKSCVLDLSTADPDARIMDFVASCKESLRSARILEVMQMKKLNREVIKLMLQKLEPEPVRLAAQDRLLLEDSKSFTFREFYLIVKPVVVDYEKFRVLKVAATVLEPKKVVAERRESRELKCFRCGKIGHKMADCRVTLPATQLLNGTPSGQQNRPNPGVTVNKPVTNPIVNRPFTRSQARMQQPLNTATTPSVQMVQEDQSGFLAFVGSNKVTVYLDSAADVSVGPLSLFKDLVAAGQTPVEFDDGVVRNLKVADNRPVPVLKKIVANLQVVTDNGIVDIPMVRLFLIEKGSNHVLLGKPELKRLGLDLNELFTKAAQETDEKKVFSVSVDLEEEDDGDSSFDQIFPAFSEADKTEQTQMKAWHEQFLKQKPDLSRAMDVPPMRLEMLPDVEPARCRVRPYSNVHVQFLGEHLKELESSGCIRRNPNAAWTSPVLVVKKSSGGFRMVVDLRHVNSKTVASNWPMPILDALFPQMFGMKYFAKLDLQSGYWQIPLHEDSQEYYSFMSHDAVWTPTRVLQGGKNCVFYFQYCISLILGDLVPSICFFWLDDVLIFGKTVSDLLNNLSVILERFQTKNVQLNYKKCIFLSTDVVFCGRRFTANGIQFDSQKIQSLLDIQKPLIASDLVQWLNACNWMRRNILNYAEIAEPLHELLEQVYASVGTRTKKSVSRVSLADKWNATHDACFKRLKAALAKSVSLAFRDESQKLVISSDASDHFWSLIVSQVPHSDLELPYLEQRHQPLAFLSGKFTGASLRWGIIEKEAYPIVCALDHFAYMLHCVDGFLIVTDNRNLSYVFSANSNTQLTGRRVMMDKLFRWYTRLCDFNYEIKHIDGESNLFCDLMSRWGSSSDDLPVVNAVAVDSSLDESFVWPTQEEILFQARGEGIEEMTSDGKMNVSAQGDLRTRLMVIAHSGLSGHRGVVNTLELIKKYYYWDSMEKDVTSFVHQCLHCLLTENQTRIPRPLGSMLHASSRNEVLHFDYMKMTNSYLLVIKDDLTGFCELYPCESASGENVAIALCWWMSRYGIPKWFVSDQGSHFLNEMIETLATRFGIKHHFTLAYSPWSNGSVERLNRDIKRATKALLSEFQLRPKDWELLIPLIQHILNHSFSERLTMAPVTAFTGLTADNALDSTLPVVAHRLITKDELNDETRDALVELQLSLEELHTNDVKLVELGEKRRAQSRKSADAYSQQRNWFKGDFVLVSGLHSKNGKLDTCWTGPYRVVEVESEYILQVENLVSKIVKRVHCSRVRFYRDSDLFVSTALLSQIAYQNDGYEVEEFTALKLDEEGVYRLLTLWRGFEDHEATWEPFYNMVEDVPDMVRRFVVANRQDPMVRSLCESSKLFLDVL